ncbi:MAG TPA: hypothetical protein VGT24_05680 [Candidatus Acidoferrales bacterium]|nr:hypothetical protein [Candidatus Acidoferrales bacterium]
MNGMPDAGPLSAGGAKPVKPDKGELRAKLDQWIPWVKALTEVDSDIPSVLDVARQALNDSNGKELLFAAVPNGVSPEDLEDCWGDRLAQARGDLVVRAAVLCCAWWNRALFETELDEWSDSGEEALIREDIEVQYVRAEKTFGLLVRFLSAEDCPGTWRDLRWEILNSYLVKDWDRANRLYSRAEELRLKSDGEIAALRGHFRFLTVFGNRIEENVRRVLKRDDFRVGLNTLFWEPRIYGTDGSDDLDQISVLLLFEAGMCDGDRELVLNDSSRSTLLDAANDLQKAFVTLPALPYPYRAVLGRCHYCTGHFHDAAEQYSALLQSQGQLGQPRAGRRLFASLTLSYRQSGETESAKQILERWARECSDEKGVYLQLAELEAQSANYQGVVEYLRREMDRNPATDTDWRLSALLALGSTQEASKNVDALKGIPLWQPVYTILENYWQAFPKLGQGARQQWVSGVVLNHLLDLPEKTRLRMAAEACARAVEIELRDRIFRQYKLHVSERASLKSAAENGRHDHRAAKFCEFLVRDGSLSLGEMVWILRKSGSIPEPIFKEFQGWLLRSQRRLMQSLGQLDPVLVFRSPAVHEGLTKADPVEVVRSCKAVIEALN